MTRSRALPYCHFSGPLTPAASVPPIVARSGRGASRARNCPSAASVSRNAFSVIPASTTSVKSAALCWTTRFKPDISATISSLLNRFPRASCVPPPRGATASPSRSATDSSVQSSSALCGETMVLGSTPSIASSAPPEEMRSGPSESARRCRGGVKSSFIETALLSNCYLNYDIRLHGITLYYQARTEVVWRAVSEQGKLDPSVSTRTGNCAGERDLIAGGAGGEYLGRVEHVACVESRLKPRHCF